MKRNPRKVKWTKAFRKSAGKDMTVDTTFEFEKRRNIPVKYDRELMGNTIKAMKRVMEIRHRRQKKFIEERLTPDMEKVKAQQVEMIHKGIDLIMAPSAPERQATMNKIEAMMPKQMEVEE